MVPSSFHPERWCGYREFSGCFRVTQQEIGPSTTWSKHEYRWRMRRISELTSGDFSKLQKISVWRIFRSDGPLLEVRLAENSEADDAHRSPARPDKMYRQAFPKRIVQIPGMVVLFFERNRPGSSRVGTPQFFRQSNCRRTTVYSVEVSSRMLSS